jgi:translation initiation factor 3 subunit H
VTKIVKHSRESTGTTAHGLLLGLDLDGTLEISNSFPLPQHAAGEEDEKSTKYLGNAKYNSSRASIYQFYL